MEYIIFIGAILLFLLFIIIKEAWDARKDEKKFIQTLYQDYGKLSKKEIKLERFVRIGGFLKKHPRAGQLDDITWNDLNMDEIFKRMDYTLSSTGEEYLYYTLHTPGKTQKELAHLEEVVDYFMEHEDERIKMQHLMHKLGYTGKFSIYDYLDYLGELTLRPNWKHYLQDLAYIPLFACLFINVSVGLTGLVLLMIYNIITYFKEKKEIEPYIISFGYCLRLITVSEESVKRDIPVCAQEFEQICKHKTALSKMRHGAFWVMSMSGTMTNASGNPLSILVDYFRMIFHVDIIQFNKMLAELNKHLDDIDVLVEQLGYLETAISIGAYRQSLDSGWCRPEFTDKSELILTEGYHPLINQPVKNSILTTKGVLLTGSNASGKSTFLKTVALATILGQTIHTCLADKYRAPLYNIYTSIALKDDIKGGDSYYIVEIKSLKRIMDAAGETPRVLCFVDEVLRGTNTVERIAASTQILKSLSGSNLTCFAATHDIELTDLLKENYANYHFEEEIRDGDIFFNYKLMEGKATTRNAIKLLEIMGYGNDIITKAMKQAQRFSITGKWELT